MKTYLKNINGLLSTGFLIGALLCPLSFAADSIDVQIKGFDDGVRTSRQQDYKEAVLFAKRNAI